VQPQFAKNGKFPRSTACQVFLGTAPISPRESSIVPVYRCARYNPSRAFRLRGGPSVAVPASRLVVSGSHLGQAVDQGPLAGPVWAAPSQAPWAACVLGRESGAQIELAFQVQMRSPILFSSSSVNSSLQAAASCGRHVRSVQQKLVNTQIPPIDTAVASWTCLYQVRPCHRLTSGSVLIGMPRTSDATTYSRAGAGAAIGRRVSQAHPWIPRES